MKRALKITGIIFAVLIVLGGIWYVDNAVYPFTARNPNYSHVEAAYNKIQIPKDWQEVRSVEEKGVAGRDCKFVIETVCFQKSQTFKVPMNISEEQYLAVLKTVGCDKFDIEDNSERLGDRTSINYRCVIPGDMDFAGSYDSKSSEVYVRVQAN